LHGGEEGADKFGFLVVQVLADAFADENAGPFEFEDAQGDAVDINNEIGTFVLWAFNGDFFGDREVIIFGMFPVDKPDSLGLLSGPFFDLDTVAEETIDGFVGVIKVLGVCQGGGAIEFPQGFVNQSTLAPPDYVTRQTRSTVRSRLERRSTNNA